MAIRIERRGKVRPLTPRFVHFLREALAGIALDDIQAPDERRVDFSCLNGLLAVEVKSLEDDGSVRISNLVEQLQEQEDWPNFVGEWPIGSIIANLSNPEAVKARVAERVGRAVVNHLKKADDQLASHARTFPRANVVRLVVVINEDHEIYDPAMAVYAIQQTLARLDGEMPRYKNIDAVMFLSERHAIQVGNEIAFPMLIVTGQPVDDAPWKEQVLDFVASKWSTWTGAHHVSNSAEAAAGVLGSFVTLDHIPDVMRRHDKWRLDYRRNPYMRTWSYDQIRSNWDDVVVVGMFAFIKDSPLKPTREEIANFLERFTHLMVEIAHRGWPMPMFNAEPKRLIEAARRIGVRGAGMDWLSKQFERQK